ncbi:MULTISPECIES: ABC transporter ATP-binding protein [Eubacteriales]|uniref:ABC transporter ATP-binding protein n=1 Tax=Eubacteriales TaxID=186802 RepID=UPI001106B17A|nr:MULTISPECIES: ABC transporter ATP-binding protein [Eubacteriales]
MEEHEKLLKIKNLKKKYQINKEESLQVLKGLSFSIAHGEMAAVMGASGCGKTTLINLICGVDKADEGSIMIDHTEITGMKKSQMAIFRRNNIGMVFQDFNLLESLNVKDNILLPLILENNTENSEERFEKIMNVLSISDLADKSVTDISGGQKQRVAIARALINTPRIILADEPTGNLDARSTKDVMEYLIHINEQFKITLVMVTHDSYAASYCNKVILLKDGIIFSELQKGKKSREVFLEEIYDFLKQIGGE